MKKTSPQTRDWIFYSGAAFAVWCGVANYFTLLRYGWDQLHFWWAIHLSLGLAATGLLLRNRRFLLWLSILAFAVHGACVIDNLVRLSTGVNLLGIVEFLYRPGLASAEYLLTQSFYFIAPVCLVGYFYLDRRQSQKRKQIYAEVLIAWVFVGAGLSLWGLHQKMSLPRVACRSFTQTELSKTRCDYTLDHSSGKILFAYRIKNKTDMTLVCRTFAQTQYNRFVLTEAVTLAPREWRKVSQVLPYPHVSVDVTLRSQCESVGERRVASERSWQPNRRFEAR